MTFEAILGYTCALVAMGTIAYWLMHGLVALGRKCFRKPERGGK